MDIKQLAEKLSKSSVSNNGNYVPWWKGWETDDYCRYHLFKAEEIAEVNALVSAATEEQLTAPECAYKYTLLHLLVWHNFYDAVKSIVARGISVDVADGGGKGVTPMMLACFQSNLAMFELLLGAGADDKRADASGRTCLHYICGARPELAWQVHCTEMTYDQRSSIADLLSVDVNAADTSGETPLVRLIKGNDNERSSRLFDKLLAKGARTDYKDENGRSLLILAIKNNHNTAALRLASDRTLVNVADASGETPLRAADDFCKTAVSLALKDSGAVGDSKYSRISMAELRQATSNAFAFYNEHDKIAPALYLAQRLISKVDADDDDEIECIAEILPDALGKDENCSVLDMIASAGISLTEKFSSRGRVWCLRDKCFSMRAGVNAIKKLVSMGVDVNTAIVDEKTPVHIIAEQPEPQSYGKEKFTYFEDAARLLDGESANVLDNYGVSAMHAAARAGHSEMLKVMAERGADINITQDAPAVAGNTPLHEACRMVRTETVRTLIELGADDSVKNVNGATAAHIVADKNGCYTGGSSGRERAEKGRLAILGMLKTIDEPRNDGMTPLMLLQYEYINFISAAQPILLDGGADVNRKDARGRTALIIAAYEHCYNDTIKELIRAGADVNATDVNGRTALHCALLYGSQDVARYLIKKGADYNRADNSGATAAALAAEKGYDTVLELMTDIR